MLSFCSPIPNSSCCQVSELNVVLRAQAQDNDFVPCKKSRNLFLTYFESRSR
jgi:hypothetical protein